MKGKIRFFGLVLVLALVAVVLVISAPSWAQKGKPTKPPIPPPTPADPAIAYTVLSGSPDHKDLMVMNADGSNKLALVAQQGVHNTRPDWSPDGKQLVFTDNALGGTAINIINRDGTGQKRILMFNSSWGPAAWSPMRLRDGQFKIAYIDHAPIPGGTFREDNDLFLVNLDGSGVQQLTNTPDVNECVFGGSFAWSFDAQYIAVAMYDHVLIYRVDWDGLKFTAASVGSILTELGIEIMELDWANTQYKLAVCGGWYDLWTVDPFNPASVIRLTNTPNIYERTPSWSPDDSRIVFANGPGPSNYGGIWVMNSDGTGATEIVPPARRAHQENPQWRRNQ